MKVKDQTVTVFAVLCIASLPSYSISTSFFGAGVGLGISTIYAGWNYFKCHFYECCADRWITSNFTDLNSILKLKLHGQPLVRQIVVPSLMGHVISKNPQKALVLSFHGWTGSGKNFVSKLIAEKWYANGMKSKFVHLFIARRDFPLHDKVDEYKLMLQEIIQKSVKECKYSLFIFDEIDDVPPGLIDALKPFIDYHEHINGVDYRKATYIFLSNIGGNEIARIVYDFWKLGKSREEITMKDMESFIQKGAFNEIGGLKNSEIIAKHLIDVYVPFFPLERSHVKLCAKDDLIAKGMEYDKEIVDKVADEMTYFPKDTKVFSTSGCKQVAMRQYITALNATYVQELFEESTFDERDLMELLSVYTYTWEIDDGSDDSVPELTINDVQEGIDLAHKLEFHFKTIDPCVLCSGKFQIDLQNCVAPYREILKDLQKKSRITCIASPDGHIDIKESSDEDFQPSKRRLFRSIVFLEDSDEYLIWTT